MSNKEIIGDFPTLAYVKMTQKNRDVGLWVNSHESTITSRLRKFVRIKPPTFHWSKVREDP